MIIKNKNILSYIYFVRYAAADLFLVVDFIEVFDYKKFFMGSAQEYNYSGTK